MGSLVKISYANGFPPLTEKQILEIEEAKKSPIVYDDDCPELTEEQYAELEEIVKERARKQKMKIA